MTKNSTKKIPRLRFKGFEGEWEEKRLGDVLKKNTNYVNPSINNLPLWSLTVKDGLIPKTLRYERNFLVKKNDKFLIVRNKDIVYNPMNITLGAIDLNDHDELAVSGYYIVMSCNKSFNQTFLISLMKTSNMINLYKRYATGSLIEKQRVQFPTLCLIKGMFPSLSEQQKIGSFFAKLDQLIDLQSKKVEQLKKLKRGYLQKMFPQKGESIPRLRFDGFSVKWKKIHLGNIAILKNGFAGDSSLNDGTYKLTRIETISDKSIDKSKLGFTNEKPKDDYALQKGDILYSNINSVKHIGKTAIFELNDKIYHGINLTRIVVNHNNLKSYFLFYLLNTNYLKIWSMSHANRAVSQASINNNTLRTMPIIYPKLLEQQKILSFILKLDIIISYNHQLLYNIKKMKSAYIQKIYI